MAVDLDPGEIGSCLLFSPRPLQDGPDAWRRAESVPAGPYHQWESPGITCSQCKLLLWLPSGKEYVGEALDILVSEYYI